MPLFDYKCKCGYEVSDRLVFCCADSQMCPDCGKLMEKQFPKGTRFNLKYDNKTDMCDWDGNTSRYWDDVKKQKKEEGKITMPVTKNIS